MCSFQAISVWFSWKINFSNLTINYKRINSILGCIRCFLLSYMNSTSFFCCWNKQSSNIGYLLSVMKIFEWVFYYWSKVLPNHRISCQNDLFIYLAFHYMNYMRIEIMYFNWYFDIHIWQIETIVTVQRSVMNLSDRPTYFELSVNYSYEHFLKYISVFQFLTYLVG